MADASVGVSAGSGTAIDTRTEATNGNHRQVVVLGDPATNAGVAPVDATAGLKVDLGADNDVTVTGTVTVAALPAGTNNIGDVDIFSNTVKDGSGTRYQPLLDADGHFQVDVLSGGGGGTQYTEADIDASITGTAILWEDTSDTLRSVSAAKPLPVNIISGSSSGTEYTEDAAAAANPAGPMTMAVRADALAGVTTTDGDNIALRATDKGELYVKQTDAVPASQSGTWNITNVSGTVSLPTGASTAANQSTIITSVQLIDDGIATVASAITTKGMAAVGTDGTNARILKTDTSGELQVDVLSSALPTGASTLAEQQTQTTHLSNTATALQIMDDWDNAASDGASVSGDVAHDAADAGEPVKVGYKAYAFDGTAPQTAVAEADRVNAIADLQGIQYVQTAHPNFWHVSADYASAQTNASVKAAPGVSLSLYITSIMISNGATAGNVTLLDGSGGTVLFEIYPAINGGVSLDLKNPIKLTANTALCITSTTVTTHSIFVSGFIA